MTNARTTIAPSSSAAGILNLLDEEDNGIKARALEKLFRVIDVHWAEICEMLPTIEELSEDEQFPAAQLAAAIASKCFYHLQEYDDALRLALNAGVYFNVSERSEYVEMMLTKCVDKYKQLRQQQVQQQHQHEVAGDADMDNAPVQIDPKMDTIMDAMFARCHADQCFEQAIGVALDTNRLDKVDETISAAVIANKERVLNYVFNLCSSARNVPSREFRLSVIEVVVKHYESLPQPDYSNVVFGLQMLNKPAEAAKKLEVLLRSAEENDHLLAYQIAFDLLESENQGFAVKVVEALSANMSSASASSSSSSAETTVDGVADRFAKLRLILLDGLDVDLSLFFLYKHSQADNGLLRSIKSAVDALPGAARGVSVLHSSTVLTNALLHAGTTRDSFLRENLEWLGKAKNWAKFSAVASFGVIHKGHVHQAMTLLQPYLPSGPGTSSSQYAEGGALYALGLIYANKGGAGNSTTIQYLAESLRRASNEVTQEAVTHGACLGVGLAAMATGDESLFESLRTVLFTDNAIAGEGAALGMGLLLLGQSDSPLAQSVLTELLTYMHETTHEKITRSLGLCIAMTVYGKEESADSLIEQLARDRDPVVRYGAMFAIAMAYCGTGDTQSLKRLLHVAVSDVNDDVRRAAVMSIGFVMFRSPEMVPKLVQLLSESFNPHLRYGACLAVGISCAGTANKEAVDLLFALVDDSTDFVRQGALLSLAMVLQQTSDARTSAVKRLRDLLASIVQDKHQPVLAKSGAIVAAGILDAGGGNVVISMQSKGAVTGSEASKNAGFLKMGSAVGMLMFLQHWFWYPLQAFLSLTFTPTMLVGLNKDFDMPTEFETICAAPQSMFAYSKAEEKKEDEKKVVATAILSTTARAKVREAKKEAKKQGILGKQPSHDSMEAIPLERVPSHMSTTSFLSVEPEKPATEVKPKKVKEATSFTLSNPSRLIPAQVRFLSLSTQQRYAPVRTRGNPIGFLMLRDNDPSAPQNVSKVDLGILGQDELADAPEPFEWDPNDE